MLELIMLNDKTLKPARSNLVYGENGKHAYLNVHKEFNVDGSGRCVCLFVHDVLTGVTASFDCERITALVGTDEEKGMIRPRYCLYRTVKPITADLTTGSARFVAWVGVSLKEYKELGEGVYSETEYSIEVVKSKPCEISITQTPDSNISGKGLELIVQWNLRLDDAKRYCEASKAYAESAQAYAKSSEDSAKASELSKSGAEDAETNAKNYSDAASKAAAEAIAAKQAALTASEVATGAAVTAGNESTLALAYAQNAGERAAAAELAREEAEKSASAAAGSANAAEKAKESIENIRVSSGTLPAGSDASVTKTTEDGVTKFNFGIPQGEQGIPGVSGLPTIYEYESADLFTEGIWLPPYSETRYTSPSSYFGLGGFMRNTENPGNDMWSVVLTAGEGINVIIPDCVEWAVAEPTFTAGYTYYLSFIPFGDKILGVWVAKELSAE